MDGENFNILVVEDATVTFDKEIKIKSGSEFSSNRSGDQEGETASDSNFVDGLEAEVVEDGEENGKIVEETNL